MTLWKVPPKIKIYEALGSIVDKRIEVDGNTAKVYSSSGNKYYTVTYDPDTNAIMCNDNGSYWQGYLGYPAICFLMAKGIIPYSEQVAIWLKDIKWKDVNTKFKNNWDKTEKYVHNLVSERGGDVTILSEEIENIYRKISENIYQQLGSRKKPPSGY
jgi:hypothetical protein